MPKDNRTPEERIEDALKQIRELAGIQDEN
jgi:hypothetical protein